MKREHLSLEEFNRKYSTERKALDTLLEVRTSSDGLCFNKHCPFRLPIEKNYRPISNRRGYLCRMCLQHFYPMTDSIMERSHISPKDWFHIIYLMLSSRNGIAAYEVARNFGYHEAAIFRLMHLVRKQMGKCLEWKFSNTVVEIDGAAVYTGRKGYSKHHKFKRGRGSQRTISVLVLKERGKKVKLYVIPSEDSDSIERIMKDEIDKSCLIITDEYSAYSRLKENGYKHVFVNHSSDKKGTRQWKDGIKSTNNAEGVFSVLKRNLRGSHIHISAKYLQHYLNECAFRLTYADDYDYGFETFIKSFGSLSKHYGDMFKPVSTLPKNVA